jgi:hypothetical protein
VRAGVGIRRRRLRAKPAYPFVNREAPTRCHGCPTRYKLSAASRDLIRQLAELLHTPFNHRPGLRRYVDKVRRRAWLSRAALAAVLAAR